ncbi:MAG: DNA repair protein RadA [Desulfitobacterium sp.]
MAKIKTRFFCQVCGQESARWLGKCPGCGEWNTLVEEILERSPAKRTSTGVRATPLTEIMLQEEERVSSGCQELNRVLGGGIVPGSFVLLGGEPGIGKSTLLLQTAGLLAKKMDVLYISGEESEKQIKLRAERLGITESHLHILTETRLEVIKDVALAMKPGLLIIDSIQTMVLEELQAAAGSVSQVREGAAFLMRIAKEEEIPIFLVGHVTKEGAIAGPRVLEHIVDTVLYFEGDRHHVYRLLRAVKNRFGSTNEIGVFEMHEDGLLEVPNPSRAFLGENSSTAPGSSVAVVMEGSRPLLVEIQALVTPTTYGPPRRTATGIDYNRVLMLLAVLDKKVGFHLGAQDVFINIAGGIRIDDPGVDLACIAAIASSMRDRPLKRYALIGEVGLTGEVRGIAQIENRVKEAMKLGFEGCILPQINIAAVKSTHNFAIVPVKTVEEAVQVMFES